MFYKMREFVKQIGDYSLEAASKTHKINFKDPEGSIYSLVTEVDLHNSRAFKKFAEENFSDLNYMIIDEESIDSLGGKLFEKVANSEYQFIFDPIDGTINYSSGSSLYGILLAVFKNGSPLYGFIYAPALDDFVYTDGQQIFREHFGKKEVIKKIPRGRSFIIHTHYLLKVKQGKTKTKFILHSYFSAAIYSLYQALGQLKGAFIMERIWDIAPLMAVANVGGFGIFDYDTKKKLSFTPKDFSDTGKIKNMKIVGFEDEFDDIKSISAGIIKD